MLGSSQNQSADNGHNINQAGRDINYNQVIMSELNFELYEEDIKEVITFFSETIVNPIDEKPIDFNVVEIDKKNELNNVSKYCNELIRDKSLPKFNKINSFLKHPANSEYLAMYDSITFELQQLILGKFKSFESFDSVFSCLYEHIIKNNIKDRDFMKMRTNVLVFLHFMYYNCDIGKKS